jgi:hypothetical protein
LGFKNGSRRSGNTKVDSTVVDNISHREYSCYQLTTGRDGRKEQTALGGGSGWMSRRRLGR